MSRITVTLDEKTVAWARQQAAELDLSLSRYIRHVLQRSMQQSQDYDRAMRRYLAGLPRVLKKRGSRYPTRDALHERGRVR